MQQLPVKLDDLFLLSVVQSLNLDATFNAEPYPDTLGSEKTHS